MADDESFLEEFLKHQLLDIGDDDGRFTNLQAASASVCDNLRTDLWQLASYTRVGMDKDIDPEEPVLVEVEAAIKEHWKLIRVKHTERPISIIRAVLWEAVRNSVDKDASAAIVALMAKSESADANLGPEGEACERFLQQVVTRVERLAEAEWTGRPELENDKEKKDTTKFDTSLLAEELLAACGPDGPAGPIQGANSKWPSENAAWSAEFSQRAAKGIAAVVGGYVTAAKARLDGVAQELATEIQNASLAASRKTDLLWWSQSQFCVTTATGFSEIPTSALPYFLAMDIQQIAPGLCPQSVEHFLAHVVNTAAPKSKKITVRKMIESLLTGDFKATVAASVQDIPSVAGRSGILSAVQRSLSDPTSLDDIDGRLAVSSKEITLPSLSRRVFWELKAMSIAASFEPGEPNE